MKFKYKGIKNGSVTEGFIEASDENSGIDKLRTMGIKPIRIERSRDITISFKGGIGQEKWGMLAEQTGILLESGIHINDALSLMKEEWKNTKFQSLITHLKEELRQGKSLYLGLLNVKDVPNALLQAVYVGEQSATLGENLIRAGKFLQKDSLEKRKLKSALAYPILLLFVTIFMILFLTGFILPVFEELYQSAEIPLPSTTVFLIGTGKIIRTYFPYMILIILLLGILLRTLYYSETHGEKIFVNLLKLPLAGKYYKGKMAQDFSGHLSVLLQSGLELVPALKSIEGTTTDPWQSNNFRRMIAGIQNGHSLTEVLRENSYYPDIFITFVRSGEETSSLDTVLRHSYEYYGKELEILRERYIKNAEPILILILALFVAFVVIAVATPMFDMVLLF